jgi:hypothetical protein
MRIERSPQWDLNLNQCLNDSPIPMVSHYPTTFQVFDGSQTDADFYRQSRMGMR